jgi:hypothetical protein
MPRGCWCMVMATIHIVGEMLVSKKKRKYRTGDWGVIGNIFAIYLIISSYGVHMYVRAVGIPESIFICLTEEQDDYKCYRLLSLLYAWFAWTPVFGTSVSVPFSFVEAKLQISTLRIVEFDNALRGTVMHDNEENSVHPVSRRSLAISHKSILLPPQPDAFLLASRRKMMDHRKISELCSMSDWLS